MKLTTTTWVTVDGVMQGLGGSDEYRRGEFERGGLRVRGQAADLDRVAHFDQSRMLSA